MIATHGHSEIDDDRSRLQFGRVHAWLTAAYWSPGIARETVEKAASGSALVIGAYLDGAQVGYARVISDRVTLAYLADVIVDEQHRGRGIGSAMVGFALGHPEFQRVRRWLLATVDAHGVYRRLGFDQLRNPDYYMVRSGSCPTS